MVNVIIIVMNCLGLLGICGLVYCYLKLDQLTKFTNLMSLEIDLCSERAFVALSEGRSDWESEYNIDIDASYAKLNKMLPWGDIKKAIVRK